MCDQLFKQGLSNFDDKKEYMQLKVSREKIQRCA